MWLDKILFCPITYSTPCLLLRIRQTTTTFAQKKSGVKETMSTYKKYSGLFFLIIGILILAVLIYFLDVKVILKSFSLLGYKIFLVFVPAIFWMMANTMCLSTLLQHKIPFPNLLFNQVTGDAYNVITPFAGLGGEPYKMKHLTSWVSLNEASEAILRDRLIHSLSGITYTSFTLLAVVALIPLERAFFITFTSVGLILMVLAGILSFIILSSAPNKYFGAIMKKLKLLEDYRSNPLSRSTFLKAWGFKMIGRFLNMVEFLVIFILLGMQPEITEIIAISAMLALSGTLLFIIPQGIGVDEAGISGAFKLIGYPLELGLTFGLIRRARVIFWALFGVALHVGYLFLKKRKHLFKVS